MRAKDTRNYEKQFESISNQISPVVNLVRNQVTVQQGAT